MNKPTIKNLIRRALLDYYKEQGYRGKNLYRKVIIAVEEHIERRRKRWNVPLS